MSRLLTGFSIIVCSHNGENQLFETLSHLDKLEVNDSIEYEVIVIDNASCIPIDFNLYSSFLSGIWRFSFLTEPENGKAFALKLGVNHAKYQWVIICDDDNLLPNDFLLIANSLIQRHSDSVLFGAMSIAELSHVKEIPTWFSENSLKYACGQQYPYSGYVTYKQTIWGAGSIFLKNVLSNALNLQELILSKSRGEDSEIFYRVMLMGGRAFYSNELMIKHRIQANRLTYDNHIGMFLNDSNSNLILDRYREFFKYFHLNQRKTYSKIKWNILGRIDWLFLGILSKRKNVRLLLSIYTSYYADAVMDRVKEFYVKLDRSFIII